MAKLEQMTHNKLQQQYSRTKKDDNEIKFRFGKQQKTRQKSQKSKHTNI